MNAPAELLTVASVGKGRLRHSVILLLLLATCGCCAVDRFRPTDDREIAARELARSGLDALHRGRVAEAEARFLCALEKSPRNPEARHHLAQLMWQQGKASEAIQMMESAIRHSGGDPAWTLELGIMRLAAGDPSGALQCAQEVLDKDPHAAMAWKLRGDVHYQRHEWPLAKQAYHRVLTREAQNVDVLLTLAEIYQAEGNPLRALATLQRLQATAPSPDQWPEDLTYRQALAQHALGRYDEAAELFAQAHQQLGDQPELLVQLARCQIQIGQPERALATVQRAEELGWVDSRWDELRQLLTGSSLQVALFP